MKHMLGWILGGPIFACDILFRKLSFAFWCKALESHSEEYEFIIGVYDIIRDIQSYLDHLTDCVILPKLEYWTVIL